MKTTLVTHCTKAQASAWIHLAEKTSGGMFKGCVFTVKPFPGPTEDIEVEVWVTAQYDWEIQRAIGWFTALLSAWVMGYEPKAPAQRAA